MIRCTALYLDEFSVYDGMTFPEEQPKSLMAKFKDFFVGSSEDRIPHHDQVQEECLLIFLDKHEKILKNLEFSTISKLNFSKFVNGVYHIYEQLQSHGLCRNNVQSDSKRVVHQLPKVRMYKKSIHIQSYIIFFYSD